MHDNDAILETSHKMDRLDDNDLISDSDDSPVKAPKKAPAKRARKKDDSESDQERVTVSFFC